jgi:uroporphyrinogen decarboxylase
MAQYIESEAFGSEINYSQNEIPTISKKLKDSFDSLASLKIQEIDEGKTCEHLKAAKLTTENITNRPVFGGIIDPYSSAAAL